MYLLYHSIKTNLYLYSPKNSIVNLEVLVDHLIRETPHADSDSDTLQNTIASQLLHDN